MSDKSVSDHLANERTYLAWVRTGIALTSFGVVIAKLRFILMGLGGPASSTGHHAGDHSTMLGLAFAGCGIVTILFAAFHYEHTRRAIEKVNYVSFPLPIYIFTGIIFLLGVSAIIYLLTLSPSSGVSPVSLSH